MRFSGGFNFARLIFTRALAAIYLIAFVVALQQFPALLGQKGLLPVPVFIHHVSFWEAPSLFYWAYSNQLLQWIAITGILISGVLVFGLPEKGPWYIAVFCWLVIWFLYLSIVNVGQTFYSFGWESMLLEAGFFAAFLGPRLAPSIIPILILRWMLFRVELGAGLIKLRGDECWRNFTCLYYHHETQPMPNPFSWYFHHLPLGIHRFGVGFSHFLQLVVPFGLFAPQWIAAGAAVFITFHQLMLIASGNYSWLNWLTIVLAVTAFSDFVFTRTLGWKTEPLPARPKIYNGLLYGLAILTLFLSIPPALNFFSERQLMNANYNPYHLVGSYGAFGSVTRERYEIIVEGTEDALTETDHWKEYEFKGKPGDVNRRPAQFAPYHLRLDWLMWFLPFSMRVMDHQVIHEGYPFWFLKFVQKLLEGDAQTLRLLKSSPFKNRAPRFIRAEVYLYHFTTEPERRQTGAFWKRERIGGYLPPVDLNTLNSLFEDVLSRLNY